LTEECYITYTYEVFCGEYADSDFEYCSKCGYTPVVVPHNYTWIQKQVGGQVQHIRSCETYHHELYWKCGKTLGDYEECTLSPLRVWRTYVAGSGHMQTYYCYECANEYHIHFYNPDWHASGVDPNCEFCTTSDLYTEVQ